MSAIPPTPSVSDAPLPRAIVDAAIAWAVRLQYSSASAQERQAFEHWLAADAQHGLAWQRVQALAGTGSPLNALPPQAVRDTLDSARRLRQPGERRQALKLLSVVGLTVGAGWMVREHAPWQRLLADASTAVGERRGLQLADGSTLLLNTDSAVGIDLTASGRVITLRRGEILIATGADVSTSRGAPRPFWVHTPQGRLQALGTRFVVRLQAHKTLLSVSEGAVAAHPAAGGAPDVVPAGASRWLGEHGTTPAPATGFGADDWTEGVLSAHDARLGDLLSELSRYHAGRIVCDPRVAQLRLSGLFHLQDLDRTLQFLVQTQPVRIARYTRFWTVVEPNT